MVVLSVHAQSLHRAVAHNDSSPPGRRKRIHENGCCREGIVRERGTQRLMSSVLPRDAKKNTNRKGHRTKSRFTEKFAHSAWSNPHPTQHWNEAMHQGKSKEQRKELE